MDIILVLLAAGDSRRFGENKLLYMLEGKPMYEHIADTIGKLPDKQWKEKIIVTQYKKIMENMKEWGYHIIENTESNLGISHSIHLAIEKIQLMYQTGVIYRPYAICFIVCDQPYLRSATIETFVKGYVKSRKGIGCLCFHGERGNPVIFSDKYEEELLLLAGDVGGKKVLQSHMEDVYFYEVENFKELEDIDMK